MKCIYCITNTQNEKTYVGKANHFKKRKAHHLSTLRSGTHRSKSLQEDFIRYGEHAFSFTVLEEIKGDFEDRETYWIKRQPGDTYNKNLYRAPSRMKEMPNILRGIRKKGLSTAKEHMKNRD